MSDLTQEDGNYLLSLDEEISNNNLVMIFYPHKQVQMTMSFKDENEEVCTALLNWTAQSGRMRDLVINKVSETSPSYWMLQFKVYENVSRVRICFEDDLQLHFLFKLNSAKVCGRGLGIKTLVDIKFSMEYGHLHYRTGAIKYDNQRLPGEKFKRK